MISPVKKVELVWCPRVKQDIRYLLTEEVHDNGGVSGADYRSSDENHENQYLRCSLPLA